MLSTPSAPAFGMTIQNNSGAEIPPYSIVVVTQIEILPTGPDQESICVARAEQYTGQAGTIFVTGPVSIDPGIEEEDDEDDEDDDEDEELSIGGLSLGTAYSDPLIYVSIDTDIDPPKPGEQWGPVPNQWSISRGGMGFFCLGFDEANSAPDKAIFKRDRGWSWGRLAGNLSAPSRPGEVTTCRMNIWHPDPESEESPAPYVKASNSGLLGIEFKNLDPSLSGSAGFWVKIEADYQMPSPYWVGCKAGSSSSSGA